MRLQKIYLSRAMTRAMAIDHPIGDAFGGAAYGERNDPVSAIVSIATMGGTYAAAGSFAAMTVMQGITFAGGAMSLLGNVTGNRTLSKLGTVASVAGGLGSVAEAAGLFKTPTLGSVFGDGAAAAGNAATGAAQPLAQSQAVGTQTPVAEAMPVPMDTGMTVSPLASSAGAPTLQQTNASVLNRLTGASAPAGAQVGASPGLVNSAVGGLDDVANIGNQAFPQTVQASEIAGKTAPAIAPQTMGEKLIGYGKAGLDFVKDNPEAAKILANTGSGLADWLSGKTDAEINALEAQTSLYGARGEQIRFEIEREKRRRANLNAGYQQVDASINVNPNAQIGYTPIPTNTGLIAGVMG